MGWKTNKKLLAEGFRDLKYLPANRCGWDCTLASLSFAARRAIERGPGDLNAWAARHGLPASARYSDLGGQGLVLWHGTSRQRADKIAQHGLFHKGGLWTSLDPLISHSYCRGRSERFATEGAVVCIVLDSRQIREGHHFSLEGNGEILRFHQQLPPEVVEYVLLHEEIRFTGAARARRPAPWPAAKFKKDGARWAPVQRVPVRYGDSQCFSSLEEFTALCMSRLLAELRELTALEAFSTLFALVSPQEALRHQDILDLIDKTCAPMRQRGRLPTFRAAGGRQ